MFRNDIGKYHFFWNSSLWNYGGKWVGKKRDFLNMPIYTYESLGNVEHIMVGKPTKLSTYTTSQFCTFNKFKLFNKFRLSVHLIYTILFCTFKILYNQQIRTIYTSKFCFLQIRMICTSNVHNFLLNFHDFVLSTKSNF